MLLKPWKRMYVSDMMEKLDGELHPFVKDHDREQLISKLRETEHWLYEGGKDDTKGAYVAKLDELKKQGDPIEQRYKDHSYRVLLAVLLRKRVNWYRQACV